ncbi:SET domain-containing protein, partial [Hesseltinella vesiculosa]
PLSFPHVSADEEVNIDEEPVDTGLIRCICDSTEDDGFTIQCDRCLTWQHAYCMNISQKNIPDRYLCALCDKRPPIRVDKKRRDGKPHPPKRTRDDEPSQLNPITKPTTTKKPKLSKRISVPKRAMDASSLVFSHAKLKWSRSPKWQTKPWRPTDAQEASVLHQELFTVMDKVSLEQQPYPHRPCLVRPLAKQAAHRVPSKSRKGVFADTQLLANTFLMQAHGDVLLKSEFKFDATNDYALLGTPCAHVLFYPSLDLCIDARERGNDARHFRRSCHPNAEVRAMVLSNGPSPATSPASPPPPSPPTTASSSTQHSICLGIFSRSSIQPDEEITLGWHWQKGHIAWRKHVEWIHSHGDCPPKDEDLALEEALQPQHRRAIQLMLDRFEAEFGDCACGDRDVCLIERLRQE